jgi:hypothetical protein
MSDATKQRLLSGAADLLGREELAQSLEVSADVLDAWICGRTSMPDGKLVVLAERLAKAVDSPQNLAGQSAPTTPRGQP